MTKTIAVAIIAILWIDYALGHDKKPVPKCYHAWIHGGYLGLIILAVVEL